MTGAILGDSLDFAQDARSWLLVQVRVVISNQVGQMQDKAVRVDGMRFTVE